MSSILDEIEEGINISHSDDESISQRLQSNEQHALHENGDEDILGLDKPIKLRTRAKIARMDNARIFSPNGLPYIVKNHGKLIRTIRKNDKKFYSHPRNSVSRSQKFDHEFDNLSSVLQFYQLWCHGLFPKANFKDCIHLVRSLNGKSAQLRLYRRELINAELHKLKVAKGIIIEDPTTAVNDNDDQQPDNTNDDWANMHTEAITEDNNGPPQSSGTGLDSLFVDSNSTEDLTPSNSSALFVDLNNTEDLAPRQDPQSSLNDSNNATTATTGPSSIPVPTGNTENESDDPFSDEDDLDMPTAQTEPSSFDIANLEQEEHRGDDADDDDDDLELELMRQNDS